MKKTSKTFEKLLVPSSFGRWRSSRGRWNLKNHVLRHSYSKFGHASCCSQICAAPADWRSETQPGWCQEGACRPCKCWWKFCKEHRHGWWNLGLRLWCQNRNPVSVVGLKHVTQTQNKHGKFGSVWKWCCFFNVRAQFITNFYPVAKRWTGNIVWRWCKNWER